MEPPAGSWFSEQEVVDYRRELLDWYDHNHRVLPWRRTPHSKKAGADAAAAGAAGGMSGSTGAGGGEEAVGPAPAELPQQQFAYWVWVSEVMLQQTQVATVIPYFKRWVAKWPTVAELAAADIETVNALWAGLGYYRRARYLLDGARFVMEKLDGKFPTTAPELLKIPGVGPYTSAAVASIAFGSAAAAVDGNVIRVVSRLRALPGDPTKLTATHAAMASELLDVQRPGCYNQALMELGATVCRPVNPDCAGCPARGVCRAAAEWEAYLADGGSPDVEDAPRVTQYPGRKAVKEKREQAVAVTVLEVICTSPPPAAAGATGAASVGKKAAAADAAGVTTATAQPPRKRQRTMQDFALAAAARKQQQLTGGGEVAAVSAGSAGDGATPMPAARASELAAAGGGGGGAVDLAALVARGARHYLLTMRPQSGLLAGLWEFPGAIIPTDATSGDTDEDDAEVEELEGGVAPKAAATSAAERQRLSDSLLRRLLGPKVALPRPGTDVSAAAPKAVGSPLAGTDAAEDGDAPPHALRVLARHDMGQYVHVFSHIRQTNYVQRLTVVFHGDLATLERLTEAAAVGASTAAGAAAPTSEDGKERAGRADSESEDVVEVVDAKGLNGGKEQPSGGSGKGAKRGGKTTAAAARGKKQATAELVQVVEEAGPSVLWVSRQQVEGPGLGLSSGARKIFQQAVGGSDAAGAGGAGRSRAAAKSGAGKASKGTGAKAGGAGGGKGGA